MLAVNIFGGIVIGVTRHGMPLSQRRRRLHQAVGRRRPGVADPGADRLARRRPAGVQGRHARLGRPGGARPARATIPRALFVAALLMFMLGRGSGPAVLALRAARRRCMVFVGYAMPRKRRGREGARRRRAGGRGGAQTEARGQGFGQGAAAHGRDRALPRQAARRAAPALAQASSATASPRCGANSRANTGSWCPRSRSPTASTCRPRPTRSRSTARWWPRRSCGSASSWSSPATAASRTCRATRCASPPSA